MRDLVQDDGFGLPRTSLSRFSVHSVGLFVGNDISHTPSPVCSQGGTPLDLEKYRSEDDTQYTVWCAADDTVPTNVVLDLREPSVVTGIGGHQSIRCGKLSMGSVASIAAGLGMIFQDTHLCPIFVALHNSFLIFYRLCQFAQFFFIVHRLCQYSKGMTACRPEGLSGTTFMPLPDCCL